MRAHAILLVGLLALVLLIASCARGAGQVTVTATEFKFDPSQITVEKGQRVEVAFQNKGGVTHNFTIPDLNVKSKDIAPGQTDRVEFTPDRSGTFKIVCTIPGHEEAGMVGQLIVQ